MNTIIISAIFCLYSFLNAIRCVTFAIKQCSRTICYEVISDLRAKVNEYEELLQN